MKYLFSTIVLLVLNLFVHGQGNKGSKATETMTVKSYDNRVHVDFQTDEKNLQISFYPCGVNQLFSIAKISYFTDETAQLQGEAFSINESCTDWIGPYFVSSQSSLASGLPQKFTGGWHGSNGDGTGNPTASTSGVRIELDGKQLSGNFDRQCKQLDLYVTNLIHGYDYAQTNKNLLKETVHYTVLPHREVKVEVRIEALDDAVIQRYYGLQSQNYALFDSVSYMAGSQLINTEAININSSCRTNEGINSVLLSDQSKQHSLLIELNTSEGLGAPGLLADGKPKAFSANYRKSYFNLINGKDLPLKKGETVFWKGFYKWD